MKYTLIIIFASISFFGEAQNKAIATFESKSLMLDSMIEGETVSLTYYFANTGSANLQLHKAKATCGCTVPSIPKHEIKPGQITPKTKPHNPAGSAISFPELQSQHNVLDLPACDDHRAAQEL